MINGIQTAVQMAVLEKMSNELCRLVTHCQHCLMQRDLLLSSFNGPFFFVLNHQPANDHPPPLPSTATMATRPRAPLPHSMRTFPLSIPVTPQTTSAVWRPAQEKKYQQSTSLKTTTTTTTTIMKKSNSAKNTTDG